MKTIRDCGEDEMIAEYLRGEFESERFQDDLQRICVALGCDEDWITQPDCTNEKQNAMRRQVIGRYRGYGLNEDMFANFPAVSKWLYCECEESDLGRIRYMNYSYWNQLSKGTSSPLDAAQSVREGRVVYGVSNDPFLSGAEILQNGGAFRPVILLSDGERIVVVEGHSRMTCYALNPGRFAGTHCYVCLCDPDSLDKWNAGE